MSPLKSKAIIIKGQISVRSETATGNTKLEEENYFAYLGCKVS